MAQFLPHVSIHALTRSATSSANAWLFEQLCFNPRTHEECDGLCYLSYTDRKGFQSTHSRGVRHYYTFAHVRLWVCFNPRTHEECDSYVLLSGQVFACFNPRTHEECDLFHPDYHVTVAGFNPRTHEECDLPLMGETSCPPCVSIHALTRSATTRRFAAGTRDNCFNPRTHEECDFPGPIILKTKHYVSIHALTRSATSSSFDFK